MFIETRNDLDEYMDRLSERLYEIAAPAITPEQLRAVWETLRLVSDVTTDLFNRLQKERDRARAAESAREVCARALQRASAESEDLSEIRDRLSDELSDMRRDRDGLLDEVEELKRIIREETGRDV